MEETILTYNEFIALDPELTVLLANDLVVHVDVSAISRPAWKYRINQGDELLSFDYVDAQSAAWARYLEMEADHDPYAVFAVTRACLENRSELEYLLRIAESREDSAGDALREILEALDRWHTASRGG